jgi:uncharacterized membrane protein
LYSPQTFFSMVFFHLEDRNDYTTFAVNPYWWLYLAVTIPLTILVGLAWYWMLKWKDYRKLQTLAMNTVDVEMHSSPRGSKSQ